MTEVPSVDYLYDPFHDPEITGEFVEGFDPEVAQDLGIPIDHEDSERHRASGQAVQAVLRHYDTVVGEDNDETETDKRPKRTDIERLGMVYGELGFAPHSREELNYAMLALDHRDVPGGFAHRLNDVLLNQQKAKTSDAVAALRSIVSKTKKYASTTRADKFALGEVGDELSDYLGTQNFLEIADVPVMADWSLRPELARGLGLVNRHIAVQEALATHEMPDLDTLGAHHIVAEMVASARVYEVDVAAKEAFNEAERRFDFWVKCLEEAMQHTAVRSIAFQALRKLGVIQDL